MLVQVEIYESRGHWTIVELKNKPDTISGWIQTDGIRQISKLRASLIEWAEEELIDLYYADEPWMIRVIGFFIGKPRPQEERTKTVGKFQDSDDSFDYWLITYSDGETIAIVPNVTVTKILK